MLTRATGPVRILVSAFSYPALRVVLEKLQQSTDKPVYWRLSIPSINFSIWMYYYNLTQENLLYIRNELLEPKIQFEEDQYLQLSEQITDAENHQEKRRVRDLLKEKKDIEKLTEELKLIKTELTEIIQNHYPFDLDDGVMINMAPFHKILPNETNSKKFWENLQNGEYVWSTLSKHLSGE